MIIRVTSRFIKLYKKLPKSVKDKAKEKEKIFKINPFDPCLNIHKLHGKYKNYWSFTVVGQYRIMFSFAEQGIADFINIGTHDIYK
jgi:addiction module RelE/StbE family toxin